MPFDENDPIIQEVARRVEKPRFIGTEKNRSLNFRCPLCGDSERFKNKRRGYIYGKDGGIWFCCFNCSTNLSFRNFLKEVEPDLYTAYNLQNVKKKKQAKGEESRDDVSFSVEGLTPIKLLHPSHPAIVYINSRQIPRQKWQFIFYGEELDRVLQSPFKKGLVFTDFGGKVFVGRNIDKNSKYRYTNRKAEEDVVFGEMYINTNAEVYVVEGLIDSLFLPNCVPALNSNLQAVGKRYKYSTLIWDNEPRNPDITHKMERAIKEGFKVVIFPDELKHLKDINEMVLAGIDVKNVIAKNKFKGIAALLKLNFWKR